MAEREHMYYNDLPCWCGRPESFTGLPIPHNLTPSADLPACRDEDPARAATLAACYPDPPEYQHPEEPQDG